MPADPTEHERYGEHFAKAIAEIRLLPDCEQRAAAVRNGWRCECGCLNPHPTASCHNCGGAADAC